MFPQSLRPSKSSPAKLSEEDLKLEQETISELRDLLLGTDRQQAQRLKPHLDKIEPKDLSRVLPTAIRLRSSQDHVLTDALMPTVAAALKIAVKRDPQAVAEAIFPVMMPAIRQAIATTFGQLVQSLDQALQYSISWQGLKWRFEAWRTGKSFSEVVLYHTLLYRVEYVFLIHRETGLLLQTVSRDKAEGNNAEVISGMMTAIKAAWQDFMHDSFGNAPDAFLSELKVGDYTIWFEQGPHLILACVIRGSAPQELRTQFLAPAIEAIHRENAEDIARFDGDPDPFVTTRHRLEGVHQARYHRQQEPKAGFRLSPYLVVPIVLALLALGVWGFFAIRDRWRWNDYVAKLEQQPGIFVTETGTRDGKYFVSGLYDPLAVHPWRVLQDTSALGRDKVDGRWEVYHSLHPEFVVSRAKTLLAPPSSVNLSFKDGELNATGIASRQWMTEARRLVPAMAGVTNLRTDGVIDEEILQLKAQMEREVPRFVVGTSSFAPGQEATRSRLIEDALELFALAKSNNVQVRMTVVGHTDETGTVELNDRLSKERAEGVRDLLVAAGIDSTSLEAIGVGSREPLSADASKPGMEANRSVTFRVAIDESRQRNKR